MTTHSHLYRAQCPECSDAAIWAASRNGATVAEIGERTGLRREKVTQILAVQRAREEASREQATPSEGADR